MSMQNALSAIESCPLPVIVAIHGPCIGAGIDLACAADIRICASSSRFSVREVRIGLAADVGTLQRFPKIVGHGSRVRELCLTGEDFDAVEAERIGFVSRIVEDKLLMKLALEICGKIIVNSPVAVAVTKESLNYSRDVSVKEGLERMAILNSAMLLTDDLGKMDGNFDRLLPHSRL